MDEQDIRMDGIDERIRVVEDSLDDIKALVQAKLDAFEAKLAEDEPATPAYTAGTSFPQEE